MPTIHAQRFTWIIALLMLSLTSMAALAEADSNAGKALADCPVAGHLMGLRYQQQSAEIKALQRQSYALATLRLKQVLADSNPPDNPAIMTDLDETAIDNTPLLVRDALACHDYTSWDTWSSWEQHGSPQAIPGALAFFKYADEQGVSIYYVSGRYKKNKADTMATLKKLGFPQVEDGHVLLDFEGPPKQVYREQIAEDHTIVLQLGDSLPDLSNVFYHASLKQQREQVKKNAAHFGKDWIVMPNATYGSWGDAELKAWTWPSDAGETGE